MGCRVGRVWLGAKGRRAPYPLSPHHTRVSLSGARVADALPPTKPTHRLQRDPLIPYPARDVREQLHTHKNPPSGSNATHRYSTHRETCEGSCTPTKTHLQAPTRPTDTLPIARRARAAAHPQKPTFRLQRSPTIPYPVIPYPAHGARPAKSRSEPRTAGTHGESISRAHLWWGGRLRGAEGGVEGSVEGGVEGGVEGCVEGV